MATHRGPGSASAAAEHDGLFFNGTIWAPKSVKEKIEDQLLTTRGDIIYASAAGTAARLAVGSSGQALVSDGTDIAWGAAAGGGHADWAEDQGTQRLAFLNQIPLTGGMSSWSWDIKDFEDTFATEGLTTLGSTGQWTEGTSAPGYAYWIDTSASSAGGWTFYGLELTSDYSAADFAVVARISITAEDSDSNFGAGVYTRQTGGAAGDHSRWWFSEQGSDKKLQIHHWHSTTSFGSTKLTLSGLGDKQFIYLAIVVDYGTDVHFYWSPNGVKWTEATYSTTDTNKRTAVNGGIYCTSAQNGWAFSGACDWLAYGNPS